MENNHLFRVFDYKAGKYIDEMWDKLPEHVSGHLLLGPTGKAFWYYHKGLKELSDGFRLEINTEALKNHNTKINGEPKQPGRVI